MSRRRLLSFCALIALIGVALGGGALSAIQDDYSPPAPTRLSQDGFETAFQAYTLLRDRSVNIVDSDTLLQGGWDAGRKAAKIEDDAPPRSDARDVESAMRRDLTYLVQNNEGRMSSTSVIDAYISGMAEAVKDPHTVYVPSSVIAKQRTAEPDEEQDGESSLFYGFFLEPTEAGDRIWEVVPRSPAAKAGLKAGDIVLSSEMLTMREDPGATLKSAAVSIKVRRDDRVFVFAVYPRREEVPIVETETLGGGIDYLRVYSFGFGADSFDRALDGAWDRLKGDRIIVDLRTNPGGAVRNVAALASRLGYQEGTLITSVDRNNRRTRTSIPRSFVPGYKAAQIVYLVNGYSYSGAEILSAFGGQSGSMVIGTPTTGTSHSALAFRVGEGVLQMGIRRNFIGQSAVDIEGKGVVLDETVELDYARLKKGEDSQIQRAIELLSGSAAR